jgi:hypothetical protein
MQHHVVERHCDLIVLSDSPNAIPHGEDDVRPGLGAVVHVAIFVALGGLGYRAARRPGRPPRARILLVVLAGAALSLTLELAQSVHANRQAPRWSFVTRHGLDAALGVLGAAAGALAAARLGRRP